MNTNSFISAVTLIRADCSTRGHSCYWWHYGSDTLGIPNRRFGLLTPRLATNVSEHARRADFVISTIKTVGHELNHKSTMVAVATELFILMQI